MSGKPGVILLISIVGLWEFLEVFVQAKEKITTSKGCEGSFVITP